jgi:hypothetical protein
MPRQGGRQFIDVAARDAVDDAGIARVARQHGAHGVKDVADYGGLGDVERRSAQNPS